MAEAAITLNGRIYRLACEDGQEVRLRALAEVVSRKLDDIVAEYGQVGHDRLLLLTALMIADDLLEARSLSAAGSAGDAGGARETKAAGRGIAAKS